MVLTTVFALGAANGIWVVQHLETLRGPGKGEVAPSFVLPTVDGKQARLVEQRGKVVLLNFWATWCRVCVKKMPALEGLQQEFGPRGLRVWSVNIEGSAQRVQKFWQGKSLATTVVLGDNRVADLYGAHTLPHQVLVDRDGQISFVQIGGGGLRRLRAAVKKAVERPCSGSSPQGGAQAGQP